MNKLEKARLTIEEIDLELVKLFEKRFEAIKDVIEYKIEKGLPVFDSQREEYLLNKNLGYLKNKGLERYYKEFLSAMFKISKDYQNDLL